MFVQSEKFVEEHGGRVGDIAVYGQESNYTTWKLARMNLAIRGIDANLGPRNADSFRADLHPDLKADFILANPPFNMSDWGGENLRQDVRKLAAESRAAGQEAFNKGMEDKSCKLLNGEVSFTNA